MTKKKPSDKKKKLGRPSAYNPTKHIPLASELAEKGKTNAEIAEALGITEAALWAWCKKYPDFLSSIQGGKDQADNAVEASLFKRTQGMKIREITVIENPDGTKRKEIKEKEIPPDPGACHTWLRCRKPKEWRDVQKMELSGKDGAPLIPAREIPDEEIEKRAREILSKRSK